MTESPPFWRHTPLDQMTAAQWESLCDGCGKCCLHKLEDADTGEITFTAVACKLLDLHSGRCRHYATRREHVPDCVPLTLQGALALAWLPRTCAYRRLARGDDLPPWHPLLTGDPESVHRAGVSVRGRAVDETHAGPLEDYVVDWPGDPGPDEEAS